MTLQLTSELEQRLAQVAEQTHRSTDELAQEAIDRFLTYREGLIAAVREADESAERDGVLTSEEVLARITARYRAA